MRAKSFIKAGQFVGEYLGLLLRREDAAGKPEEYTFNIDYTSGEYEYCVYGKSYGNHTRFFNHSW